MEHLQAILKSGNKIFYLQKIKIWAFLFSLSIGCALFLSHLQHCLQTCTRPDAPDTWPFFNGRGTSGWTMPLSDRSCPFRKCLPVSTIRTVTILPIKFSFFGTRTFNKIKFDIVMKVNTFHLYSSSHINVNKMIAEQFSLLFDCCRVELLTWS